MSALSLTIKVNARHLIGVSKSAKLITPLTSGIPKPITRLLCHSANKLGLGEQDVSSTNNGPDVSPEGYSLQNRITKDKTKFQAGQPIPSTHPHILKLGEITPGITYQEYVERRSKLIQLLLAHEKKHHVIILPSMPKRFMIDKIPYLYRQDTDMLYMSGCQEPDCVLLLHTLPDQEDGFKSVMFTPQYDPGQELWDGPRTTPSGAAEVWGVDEGLPLVEITKYLASLELDLSSPDIWYHYRSPVNSDVHRLLNPWVTGSRQGKMESAKPFIHRLRVIKSPAEIELMRKTCDISSQAIFSTIKSCKSPTSEHELFATVDYHCRMQGANHLAYPPVVAGGPRANIIHYIKNNQIINPGELVLMDAGAEYHGYSGDVTRTWPIDGKFSSAQRDVYEAVIEVQKEVIKACSHHPTLNHLFSLMCLKLGKVLQELCILPNSYSDSELMRASYGFCPHHVSHFLGMDVHDTPQVLAKKAIMPNSIITVEPGIYISQKNKFVPSRYNGIGVRIEDDILITDNGCEVLTNACPTHPDEIEKYVGCESGL